jgi:hypothetical protein
MAPRTRKLAHDDFTRTKIQTSQLINRLTGHVLGDVKMSATQVRAAEVLLRKSMPDLAQIHGGGDDEKLVIEIRSFPNPHFVPNSASAARQPTAIEHKPARSSDPEIIELPPFLGSPKPQK